MKTPLQVDSNSLKRKEYYFDNPLCNYKKIEKLTHKKFGIIEPISPGCPGNCFFCFAGRNNRKSFFINNPKVYANARNRILINETTEATIPGYESQMGKFYSNLPQKNNILNLVSRFPVSLIKTLKYSNLEEFEMVILQISYTGLKGKNKEKWEPYVESPKQKLNAIRNLIKWGYNVSVRFEPLIPTYHNSKRIMSILNDLRSVGVKHITIGTLKLNAQLKKKLKLKDKVLLNLFEDDLFYGEYYLKAQIREKIISDILTFSKGLHISFCLEGYCKNCPKSINLTCNSFCEGFSPKLISKIRGEKNETNYGKTRRK